MQLLAQFLFRLTFGLAVGMAVTSSRQVASGYFRNHLYVTLGLATLSALAVGRAAPAAMWLATAAAVASYVSSVCWLYESPRSGRVGLWVVAGCGLAGALACDPPLVAPDLPAWLQVPAVALSGLVLGVTLAAMLLGHWYLNAPGMELAPLRRLLAVSAVAVGLQMLLSGADLALALGGGREGSTSWWLFVVLRWAFGLVGVLVLLWMARRTLAVPNTQSATGILYVAVMGVFVGELAAELLSAQSTIAV